MKKFTAFFRREPVLILAALCALISFFFCPPSLQTLESLDGRVLGLLFCLMAAVAGLSGAGLLRKLSALLLRAAKTRRQLILLLVLLCFFSSMLMTNDVSLVTFVPLTLLVLQSAGLNRLLIPAVVLETVAANLGSALTPVGNPQNLFLYSAYEMTAGEFFSVTLPLCGASLLLVILSVFLIPAKGSLTPPDSAETPLNVKKLFLHLFLLLLCLLTVFSVLDWRLLLLIMVAALLLFDRDIFKRVDYFLLLTFVCFFLFSGNLSRIPAVRTLLTAMMEKNAFLASLAASQIISNVPAALLLSPFTAQAKALLLGTDIGGLGTLIASLASLISYKIYARSEGAQSGRYILIFTLFNAALLIPLIALAFLLLK